MLEIISTKEYSNDGEIFEKVTEFILDGISGKDIYVYNWYEPLEYCYDNIRWNGVDIDINLNANYYRIKGVELLNQSQIDELSRVFNRGLKEAIKTENYVKI